MITIDELKAKLGGMKTAVDDLRDALSIEAREKPLAELARLAGEAGTKGIVVAGSMLRSRNKEKTGD